jgi:hypothetical protein
MLFEIDYEVLVLSVFFRLSFIDAFNLLRETWAWFETLPYKLEYIYFAINNIFDYFLNIRSLNILLSNLTM